MGAHLISSMERSILVVNNSGRTSKADISGHLTPRPSNELSCPWPPLRGECKLTLKKQPAGSPDTVHSPRRVPPKKIDKLAGQLHNEGRRLAKRQSEGSPEGAAPPSDSET